MGIGGIADIRNQTTAGYVAQVELMLGPLACPELLRRMADQHDQCADWCEETGRLVLVEAFRAAAVALRERAERGDDGKGERSS